MRQAKTSRIKRSAPINAPESKLVSAPKAKPQASDRKSSSVKRLLHRKRGLEIRRELLSKSVFYDGWEEDVAANNNQLRDIGDLLRQCA
jgi:hypothetical protein